MKIRAFIFFHISVKCQSWSGDLFDDLENDEHISKVCARHWKILQLYMRYFIRFYVFYCEFWQQKYIYMYFFFHFKTQTYGHNHRYLWSHITKCFLLYSTIKFNWSLLFFRSISFFLNQFSNPVGCHIGKSCFACFCSLHEVFKIYNW